MLYYERRFNLLPAQKMHKFHGIKKKSGDAIPSCHHHDAMWDGMHDDGMMMDA